MQVAGPAPGVTGHGYQFGRTVAVDLAILTWTAPSAGMAPARFHQTGYRGRAML
ncbi:hypothetical protein ACFVFJ_49880 [Streptomyces sp. NPDC057717]|uniref:hypothetical protein n=1 Tax=Streptomyces sp. NPDC057717 TaxID=3346224 RepID=UPI0036CE82BF